MRHECAPLEFTTHDDELQPVPSVGVLMADVHPRRTIWLWPGRIPFGKITVLDGDPGLGKSTATLDIAARVSRGASMPGGSEPAEPCGVVLLSAEDDLGDTIRPRLDAAGADVTRVLAIETVPGKDRPPSFPDDIELVRAAIRRVDAKLVIVDPLMAYLSSSVDGHRDQDVRRVLHVLSNLAEETGAAVLLVRHLNKSAGGSALYRGGGSIGIIGAARSGLLIARDPHDDARRVLASTKCNLAAQPESVVFHLEQSEYASRVVWDGTTELRADDLMAPPSSEEERSAIDEAKDFLLSALGPGPVAANELLTRARSAGITDRTLKRAKKSLGVVAAQRTGEVHGGWYARLPQGTKATDLKCDGPLAPCPPDQVVSTSRGHDVAATTASEGQAANAQDGLKLPMTEWDSTARLFGQDGTVN